MSGVIGAVRVSELEFAALVDDLNSDASRYELLTDFLREDNPIYDQRGAAAVVRMRGWALLAFERIGLPDSALLFVLEELDTGRDAYLVAAAARALRAYARPSSAFAPLLVQAISNIRYRDEVVCFERYGQYAVSADGTTAIGEVLQTLAWLGPHAGGVLPDLEALIANGRGLSKPVLNQAVNAARAIRQMRPQVQVTDPALSEPSIARVEGDCCVALADLGTTAWWPRRSRRGCEPIQMVRLEDQEGSRLMFQEFFHGRPSIVVFFYTRCDNPQKCSLTIAKLARVQQLLTDRGLSDRVRTAAITYDPAFDLPARLQGYGKSRGMRFDADNRMLRATDGIASLRSHFKLGVNFIESLVNRHRVELYILDTAGRIAASFERIRWDERTVVDKVATVLEEERPAAPETSSARVAPVRSGGWLALAAIAPFGTAFFPKCPLCWSAYLSALGVTGLERIPYSPWLLPIFGALMLVNLGSLWMRAYSTRRWAGFYLGASGSFVILVLAMTLGIAYAAPCGVALTLAGSLLGVFARGQVP
jgi:protein SCO1/2